MFRTLARASLIGIVCGVCIACGPPASSTQVPSTHGNPSPTKSASGAAPRATPGNNAQPANANRKKAAPPLSKTTGTGTAETKSETRLSTSECKRMLDHVIELQRKASDKEATATARLSQEDIETVRRKTYEKALLPCEKHLSRAEFECVLAATEIASVRKCQK